MAGLIDGLGETCGFGVFRVFVLLWTRAASPFRIVCANASGCPIRIV